MKRTNHLFQTVLFLTTMTIFNSCIYAGGIRPNLNYVTKTVRVGSFSAVSLRGNCDVIFTPSSDKQQLELYASDNVIDYLEVYVKGETLIVGVKKGVNILRRNKDKMELHVSAPMIGNASVTGSGTIRFTRDFALAGPLTFEVTGSGDIFTEAVTCKDFRLHVTGSGDITVKEAKCEELRLGVTGSGDITLSAIEANAVKAKVTGSGDIELAGNAAEAQYGVTGSGDINAKNLRVKVVMAEVSGSGDIDCYAVDHLTAHWSGSGDISYRGNPQITTSHKQRGLHKIGD